MKYTILETHLTFKNDKLTQVAVLWLNYGDIGATYSTLNPKAGYQSLTSNDTINPELFQRVAGGGSYLDENQKKQYFPKQKW
ncbi:hypothetical protein [Tenacibaculum finnmarkense]|uniref:hypothetical protein n=1 Tax=Tenacibaculum TaxID=104267 RepID=UPI000C669347|nr:hypothetical protein [Tenacibaculum finnmarkense]MDB0614016.1 hypothetical protein [Tenacibaculum dicentrarchi]MBE7648304.1 hypothetical protein [Tenacibaculum finnmarkense genomovar ulcerans]MCD8403638.1 hypothetical protein [Tenacibaculum finnmarkense genomovar finnmarkense]MCG8236891.1 hypothetical protein [Tenacibaculum finnmarkense genomovar ulcerans]MCG8239587.1 hypothetical protein [Tenacibaculum finnmarkense genomovar ulcerans]